MSRTKDGFLYDVSSGIITHSLSCSASGIVSPTSSKLHYHTIVIGAGFAGLVAARNLSAHHSDDVLILEARDRLGGRTWSSNVLDHKFEMGGQWVHWNQPHVFSEMQRYHMGTDLEDTKASYDLNTLIFNHDGQGAEALSNPIEILKEMDICAQDFFDVDGQRGRLIFPQPYSPLLNIDHIKKYDHLSVQDRFNEISSKHSAKIIALTSSMIASFGNDDPNRVGFIDALKWFVLSGYNWENVYECANRYKIREGTSALVLAIFSEFKGDIKFNTEVNEIQSLSDSVQVITSTGHHYTANNCICTIPLQAIHSGRSKTIFLNLTSLYYKKIGVSKN